MSAARQVGRDPIGDLTIHDISDLSEVADICLKLIGKGKTWYRGQTDFSWHLTPRIFRPDAPTKQEARLCNLFRLEAPSRYPSCPLNEGDEAKFNWLCLMRHYGLPTRLLDWTESILAAAHFALDGPDDTQGAIWVLFPRALNHAQSGLRDEWWPGAELVRDLATSAFAGEQDKDLHLAVVPNSVDLRMLLQQARFTIHGGLGPSLDELTTSAKFVVRFVIPEEDRMSLRHELRALGISKRTLFSDLGALASDLTVEMMQMLEGD